MREGLLTMSRDELNRVELMRRIEERRITQVEAAVELGLSLRQVERLYRAYRERGPAELISKKRGRPSNRRLPQDLRVGVLRLVRERYGDFGPTLAHEKLVELHELRISTETLRQWMIADGLWETRSQRRGRVHQPRTRRSCLGELVQVDGCDHEWFEDRGPRCALLVFVDDATSRLMELRFAESESTFDYFACMQRYVEAHGKPVALYSDKAGIFRVNAAAPIGGRGTTQFARAMSELNIDILCANSPQAKGRVERAHQTLQDRLVKELRLAGISNIVDGNRWLPTFQADYNRRFAQEPRSSHNAHRPLGPNEALRDIFLAKEERKLSDSLTLHYKRVLYLIEPNHFTKTLRGKRVLVVEAEDGSVSIRYGDQDLPARAFERDGNINQQDVDDNKRLGRILAQLREKQLEAGEQRIQSRATSLREKKRLRESIAQRR
jgi:hypothetical protein